MKNEVKAGDCVRLKNSSVVKNGKIYPDLETAIVEHVNSNGSVCLETPIRNRYFYSAWNLERVT